jgi:DNA-binding protein HU-beta
MRKVELKKKVNQQTGVPKEDVSLVLETLIAKIKETLSKGENVTIRGFGTFEVKKCNPKKARHIQEGKTIIVPAHCKPGFKPSDQFKTLVNNIFLINNLEPSNIEELMEVQ